MPCGSPLRLDSIRESPDRRMLAPPRSLSQLTAPFFAIPSQAIHHTASVCRMINIPGGCLRLRRGISSTRWAIVSRRAEHVARKLRAYTPTTSTESSTPALLSVSLRPCGRKDVADRTLFLRVASCLDAFSSYPQQLSCPAMPFRTTGTPEAARRCSSRTEQRFLAVFFRFHQVEADLSHDGLTPAHVPL